MDALTRQIQGKAPWGILFMDDVVLIGETCNDVYTKLELRRHTLVTNDFELSRINKKIFRMQVQ